MAGPLLHPSQRFENHSIFSPTLHAASVNKIEMNSVIIRLSGQGPYLAEGEKNIFSLHLSVFGRFILVKLWLHPRYKAAGTRRTKKKTDQACCFHHQPPRHRSIWDTYTQTYRCTDESSHTYTYSFMNAGRSDFNYQKVPYLHDESFDTSRAILMKTCPTFLHLHSKKNNLYESTAVWLDPLHTAGVPGIPERGEWNENTGLIKQMKFLFFFLLLKKNILTIKWKWCHCLRSKPVCCCFSGAQKNTFE